MFSRLDPVFSTTLRHAEQTDARLGIREHENRDDPRKSKGRREDEEDEQGGDRASVSVLALRNFLFSMLEQDAAGGIQAPGPAPAQQAVNPAAAAARAYRSTAYAAAGGTSRAGGLPPGEGAGPAQGGAQTAGTAGDMTLSEAERTRISELIGTLDELLGHDIFELTIGNSSAGLLQGLAEAAAAASAKLRG